VSSSPSRSTLIFEKNKIKKATDLSMATNLAIFLGGTQGMGEFWHMSAAKGNRVGGCKDIHVRLGFLHRNYVQFYLVEYLSIFLIIRIYLAYSMWILKMLLESCHFSCC
jgi:hypothetical protein